MTASRPMDVDRRHSQQSFASSAKVDSEFIFSLLSERQVPCPAPTPRFYKVEKHWPSGGRGYRQSSPNVSFEAATAGGCELPPAAASCHRREFSSLFQR